ncbi:hypothetical protein D3C84_1048710 [compost metagenome]
MHLRGCLRRFGEQLIDQCVELKTAVTEQFASNQIQRLDAVGALVELGDAAVAHQLFHAPLANEAVPAVQLHTKAGDLLTAIGKEGFDDRNQ